MSVTISLSRCRLSDSAKNCIAHSPKAPAMSMNPMVSAHIMTDAARITSGKASLICASRYEIVV